MARKHARLLFDESISSADFREMFSDSQVWTATIASASETTLGNISVPANETWIIYKIWCQGTGGIYRLDIPGTYNIDDLNGKFIQNSDGDTTKDSSPYDVDILVQGAATLTVYVDNNAADSTSCNAMIQYLRYAYPGLGSEV